MFELSPGPMLATNLGHAKDKPPTTVKGRRR